MTPSLETDPNPSPFLTVVNRADDPDRGRFIDWIAQMTLEAHGRLHCLYLQQAEWRPYISGMTPSISSIFEEPAPDFATSFCAIDEENLTARSLPRLADLAKAAVLGLVMMSMACVAMGILGPVWFL